MIFNNEDGLYRLIIEIRNKNSKNGSELLESTAAMRHYLNGWGGACYLRFCAGFIIWTDRGKVLI